MPSHNRYSKSGQLKTLVAFTRRDLIVKLNEPIYNPYQLQYQKIPCVWSSQTKRGKSYEFCIGPNIQDYLERKIVEVNSQKKVARWELRQAQDFFATIEELAHQELKNAEKSDSADSKYHPFKQKFATGGKVFPSQTSHEGFILIEKQSTVSINSLIFNLVVGMEGDVRNAVSLIQDLASKAWERDLLRAENIYKLIVESEQGFILEEELAQKYPPFRANSTISQEIETELLKKACRWLGVNPRHRYKRTGGRPKGETVEQDNNSLAGEFIKLTIEKDEAIVGVLVGTIGKFKAGLDLAVLPLFSLVELLGLLQDGHHSQDIDLLEAYLDASDENWRTGVFAELEREEAASCPYSVLGLEFPATLQQVKSAYRKLMNQVHPDRDVPDWIAVKVNQAYEQILSDLGI